LFFSELSNFRCNGEVKDLGNFVGVVRTLVVISTSSNVVRRCNKLTTSLGSHMSSKLQSSESFSNGGSLGKVTGIFEGGKTFKVWC